MLNSFHASFLIPFLTALFALAAPFFFPWPFAFAIGILTAFFFPPAVILNGVLIDTLYFDGASRSIPYFTILALLIAILAAFVQQFVKTRIMS